MFSCGCFLLHLYCCCLSLPLLPIINFANCRHPCCSSFLLFIVIFATCHHPCYSLLFLLLIFAILFVIIVVVYHHLVVYHCLTHQYPMLVITFVVHPHPIAQHWFFLFIITLLLVVTHTFKLGTNITSTYCIVIHHHLVAHFTSFFFVLMIFCPHLQCACYLQL